MLNPERERVTIRETHGFVKFSPGGGPVVALIHRKALAQAVSKT
jgi:hypothetical protein